MLAWRPALVLAALAGCGFPAPADLPDAAPPADAVAGDSAEPPPPPGSTIQVSPAGDDANDGLDKPVKTLKRAIGIAAANTQITHIVLASGRYTLASGENFPYTVPTNVTVTGPTGGGAILVGSKAEPGLAIDTGTLRDLELEDFLVGIVVTGMTRVANVRIRSSALALRAETAAKLVADNLDISGTPAACSTGIVMNGTADLKSTRLAARGLAATLEARDQSTVDISNANILGNPNCVPSPTTVAYVVSGDTVKPATIKDSLIDGGNYGISMHKARLAISNTIIRNMKSDGLAGGFTGVEVTGGEISGNATGFIGGESDASFSNVLFKNNSVGVYWYGNTMAKLTMRGCDVNSTIEIGATSRVDLGTAGSPGNNSFRSSTSIALEITNSGDTPVEAIGNTWAPIQGANQDGRYPQGTTVRGPVARRVGNNYSIDSDRQLDL